MENIGKVRELLCIFERATNYLIRAEYPTLKVAMPMFTLLMNGIRTYQALHNYDQALCRAIEIGLRKRTV